MNEIMNVMKERRSIRKFKPDMPSKEDLNQIIEAGLYAQAVWESRQRSLLLLPIRNLGINCQR